MMLRPHGIFVSSGKIYVTDPGIPLVHIFDIKKRKHSYLYQTGDRNLISPIGIAVDAEGRIFVSDSMSKRIAVFDAGGNYLRDIGSSESFLRPTGIALHGGKIYVVDTHAHKVLSFDAKTGGLLFSWGSRGKDPGFFNYPTHIFASADGLLHITDSMNFRIQVFDMNGNFISAFGEPGNSTGNFSKPKGVAVDSDGHIYVADAHFDAVQIFDRRGNILLGFGKTGKGIGEMAIPAGVYIDEEDRIYVADSYNRRVQVFQYLK